MKSEQRLEELFKGLLSTKLIKEVGFTIDGLTLKEPSPCGVSAGMPLTEGQEAAVTADDTECAVTAFSIQVPNTLHEAQGLLDAYHQFPRFRLGDAIVSMKLIADDQSLSLQQKTLATLWFSGFLIEHQCQNGLSIKDQIRRHRQAVKAHKVILHFCILSSGTWTLLFAETEGRLHAGMPS